MKKLRNFSIGREFARLEEMQNHLVLITSVLSNDPLYAGHFDDLVIKLGIVVGAIEDALCVFDND